jgi:hypothetical protein
MNDWLYLLLIPALLCLIWFWTETRGSRSPMRRNSDKRTSKTDNRFHAVTIEPCSHACSAVKVFEGERFLAYEVSRLPVAGCDASRCQCTYKHYADRRSGEERRHASTAMNAQFNRQEHREGGDRRHAYP